MNIYLRKDGRYESRIPTGKRTEKGHSFMFLQERKSSALRELLQFARRTDYKVIVI